MFICILLTFHSHDKTRGSNREEKRHTKYVIFAACYFEATVIQPPQKIMLSIFFLKANHQLLELYSSSHLALLCAFSLFHFSTYFVLWNGFIPTSFDACEVSPRFIFKLMRPVAVVPISFVQNISKHFSLFVIQSSWYYFFRSRVAFVFICLNSINICIFLPFKLFNKALWLQLISNSYVWYPVFSN